MSEEKIKILKMVAEGKLTPEEAERLLSALSESQEKKRFFRVRVFTQKNHENPKVKVDIPISVLKLASKMSSAFRGIVPEGFKVNIHGKEIYLDELTPEIIDKILSEISEEEGKFMIAQVSDEENGEFVEVYIE
ncbi:hypothetical protein A2Y85_06000 [candidate division WOR-3 bacterium RBG_13_43_14]|uniref:YvlB/LiaX N-terminal domain-containing protein n=1 Tax=candidate division WOR-3 bacterium RBG_13_43_14 TaxID=1802590 RepID=A0A1F4U1V7_UNCW3|nr:MAG: hypothetical protein A2Y85_06000 [candidate division WOR-3 bacterium RBG_13_43_14]